MGHAFISCMLMLLHFCWSSQPFNKSTLYGHLSTLCLQLVQLVKKVDCLLLLRIFSSHHLQQKVYFCMINVDNSPDMTK